jgi:signal transduction histidine kinase
VKTPQPADEIAKLRQLVVRLSRLVEISVTLNSTLELDRLLQFIIRSAADIVDSEAASILLIDDRTNELYFAAATDIDPEDVKKLPVPMEGSIAGTVYREDRPVILNNVSIDSSQYKAVRDPGSFVATSLIGVPLRIREQVTGVLEAVNKREGEFDEADLQALTNIASQAAVAINNARLVEELTNANEELGKLDKLKGDFIAIASHELRTPLGLILGNAALLKDGDPDEIADYADGVLNSAMRMRALIEDMTNLNMLQVGSAELILALKPLQPVLDKAQDEMIDLVMAKGLKLEKEMPETPIEAMIDEEKLTMATINLLTNAIRFTSSGGRIRLLLEVRGREAWIRVQDTGIGLKAEQMEPIFDQFYQAEDHLTRSHDGLGLGLPIVRAIAEAHGGRAWVESEGLNQGATFTISLPLSMA